MEPTSKIPNKEQLQALPIESIRIYAARNALRVLPLTEGGRRFEFFKELERPQSAASISLAAVLPLVADFESGENIGDIAVANARSITDAGRSAAIAINSVASVATPQDGDAVTAIAAAVYSAYTVVTADIALARDQADASSDAVAAQSSDYAAAARYDYELLKKGEPIQAIPLWQTDRIPKALTKISAQWRSAMNTLGLEAHVEAYDKLLFGEKDAAQLYIPLIEEWLNLQANTRKFEANSPEKKTAQPSKLNTPEDGPEKTGPNVSHNETIDLAGPLSIKAELAAQQDHLGRERLVSAIADLLSHSEHTDPLTIGLLGDWGAGKTTVLNLLEKKLVPGKKINANEGQKLKYYVQTFKTTVLNLLEKKLVQEKKINANEGQKLEYHVQTFNAWSYEHSDNIQAGVAQEAVVGMTHDKGTFAKLSIAWSLAKRLGELRLHRVAAIIVWVTLIAYITRVGPLESYFNLAQALGIGVITAILFFYRSLKSLLAHPFAKEFKTYLNLPDYSNSVGELPVFQAQLKGLASLCLKGNRRLLFVVDDLDRCSAEGIVKVFEAVRLCNPPIISGSFQ